MPGKNLGISTELCGCIAVCGETDRAHTRKDKARFPLGEFGRATRSENKNSATWLVAEAANFFANQSRYWILVFASRRANKFA